MTAPESTADIITGIMSRFYGPPFVRPQLTDRLVDIGFSHPQDRAELFSAVETACRLQQEITEAECTGIDTVSDFIAMVESMRAA